jgi:hypothetical protein
MRMATGPMFGVAVLAAFTLFLSAACQSTASPRNTALPAACVAGPLPDDSAPSREGFFREALFAAQTARTPRYDDYTAGSYHVDKLDVATGLPGIAHKCGATLDSVLVLGPTGLLWTYHVVTVLHDQTLLRVNSLVMPHARITGKATGLVTPAELERLYTELLSTKLLRIGVPRTPTPRSERDLDFEFSYDLLFVRFGGDAAEFRYGSLGRAAEEDRVEVERLEAALNRLLGQLHPTYPVPRGK